MRHVGWIVCIAVLALHGLAMADGCFIPTEQEWREGRERSLINEPEQKAVVFFSKGREQLIISPSYQGASSSFAWVVPVPSRPQVEILKGAIFHELAELTMPKQPVVQSAKVEGALRAPGVSVLERKTVGAYDVSVLSATDGQALMRWLKANKYHIPDKAIGPMKGYVKQGWTFVASRIKVPSNAKGLRTGTLAPLRLTFSAKQPVYPMKLSSANPKQFDVLVYLVLPSGELRGRPRTLAKQGWTDQWSTSWSATLSGHLNERRRYPTLSTLYSGEMQIYTQRCYVDPEECKQDIVWKLPHLR